MMTERIVQQAKACYTNMKVACIGDSGDVKCFFCPGCVLGIDERILNLITANTDIFNAKEYGK